MSTTIMSAESEGNALLRAIRERSWDCVTEAVKNGADVNAADKHSFTPLHTAILTPDAPPGVITELISHHNINVQGYFNYSPLHLAVSEKRWDLVAVLVEHGADVNLCDGWKNTSLLAALGKLDSTVDAQICMDVVGQLTSPENVNVKDAEGRTPLRLVIWGKKWKLVAVLLQRGADVNVRDKLNNTPLHAAVKHSDAPLDVVAQLISSCNINSQDAEGCTALRLVIWDQKWDLVSLLLRHGADVNSISSGETPLLKAMDNSELPLAVAKQLVSPDNINVSGVKGDTALHLAASKHKWDLVPALVNLGADINLCNSDSDTPLLIAANQPGVPLNVVTELASTQNINMQGFESCTALHLVVENERWNLIEALIRQGADVNIYATDKGTLLHIALGCPDVPLKAVSKIVSPGNVNRELGHRRALHMVIAEKRWDLVPVLVQNGAETCVYDIIIDILNNANTDCVRHLLQTLCMPYYIQHMEFVLGNGIYSVKVNRKETILPKESPISQSCMVDIICNLLQQTGLVKLETFQPLPTDEIVNVWSHIAVIKCITKKYSEFKHISHNPATMKKLCVMTIRQHLTIKSDESFAQLGLPAPLLSLVTLNRLAEELNMMWCKGKLDKTKIDESDGELSDPSNDASSDSSSD